MAHAGIVEKMRSVFYQRARFVAELPANYLYHPSHFWIVRSGDEEWRVGLTPFALRMLGEMVDHGFTVKAGEPVQTGQMVGWVEGFKAISDLYCIAQGQFAGGNPALQEQIRLLHQDPYGQGWLYAVCGKPDPKCVDVAGYQALLDATIDRIVARQSSSSV